jgi:retinol dehydrogenase-12
MPWYIYILIIIIALYLFRKWANGPYSKHRKTMKGKVVIITGASAGIGKGAALELLKDGADVVFATRDKSKTFNIIDRLEADKERAHWIHIDLCSLKSVERFVEEFKTKFDKVDILMNNAGGFPDNYVLSEDCMDSWLQANHISHMYLTYLLLDYFNKDEGRVINLSSLGHKFADYSEDSMRGLIDGRLTLESCYANVLDKNTYYCNLKIANIYFTRYLAQILEKKYAHIKTFSVHPGVVLTELFRWTPNYPILRIFIYLFSPLLLIYFKTPTVGAQTQLDLCYRDWKELENGGYFDDCRLTPSSRLSQNDAVRDLFIEYSYKLLKNAGRNINFDK